MILDTYMSFSTKLNSIPTSQLKRMTEKSLPCIGFYFRAGSSVKHDDDDDYSDVEGDDRRDDVK